MVCGLDSATLGYTLHNLHLCLYEQHVYLFDFCMYDTKSLGDTHTKASHIQFHPSALHTQHLNYTEIHIVYFSVHATWVYSNAAHGTARMCLSHTHRICTYMSVMVKLSLCVFEVCFERPLAATCYERSAHSYIHSMQQLHVL